MGIFDKALERIAAEIIKAAPQTTAYNQAELNSIGQQQQGYGNTVGLPRDTSYYNVPFTPGNPIFRELSTLFAKMADLIRAAMNSKSRRTST